MVEKGEKKSQAPWKVQDRKSETPSGVKDFTILHLFRC